MQEEIFALSRSVCMDLSKAARIVSLAQVKLKEANRTLDKVTGFELDLRATSEILETHAHTPHTSFHKS